MRLFVATSFPEPVTRDLNERLAAIKPELPPAAWVRPETQHLTFAFLGEQEASILENLAPSLELQLREMRKFTAVLAGCGFFPNPRRARVGWVGLEPAEAFGDIARAVRTAVASSGITLDRADFRPHLTLMRMRDTWPPASIDLFERTLRDYRSAPFDVDSVILYSSQLNPKGAVHTPVRTFPMSSRA